MSSYRRDGLWHAGFQPLKQQKCVEIVDLD